MIQQPSEEEQYAFLDGFITETKEEENGQENFILKRFNEERERAKKFQQQFYGIKNQELSKTGFDQKQYVVYVLTQGSIEEKRMFLSSIKSKILLAQKIISIST